MSNMTDKEKALVWALDGLAEAMERGDDHEREGALNVALIVLGEVMPDPEYWFNGGTQGLSYDMQPPYLRN